MDKPRTGFAEKRRTRRILFGVAAAVVIAIVSIGVARLEPAAPEVKEETLFFGEVKRGPMLREVRGPGQLVPIDIRWISAPVGGRIERIPALPPIAVTPDTVLLVMSDPEIEQNLYEAESQLRAAEADLEDVRAQMDSQLLNQQAQAAAARSQAEQARLQADADQKLYKDQLIPELTMKLSRLRAEQSARQAESETQRVTQGRKSAQAQIAAQRARVEQFRATYNLRRRQVESLTVRAGIPGVLQELPVQVGQRVNPGTTLARVARPEELKAELRIPEVLAKDVLVGQRAAIDTRNGIIPGRVIRIAPSAQEGTVTVDVSLDGQLPKGARPNLSVDGNIEIERLDNVLFVGRPTFGQPNSRVEMFKVAEDGRTAERVQVQLGRMSVSTTEIVSGLAVGDRVVLSDMSQYDNYKKVRLD